MSRDSVTRLLGEWERGETSNLDQILPLIYDELHQQAQIYMRAERSDHTIQATALVHEAYLKLVDQDRVAWQGRGHFMAVASLAMRRLLVDHARRRSRRKRGGDLNKVPLTAQLPITDDQRAEEIVLIDRLLEKLATFDSRAAKVVECRFFGGLSIDATATALETSTVTVKRTWRFAKAWLRREMDLAV